MSLVKKHCYTHTPYSLIVIDVVDNVGSVVRHMFVCVSTYVCM